MARISQRSRPAVLRRKCTGRRHSANTIAALAIRSQATPSGSIAANSSTAKDGPR
jgi:hypothetical protein